MEKLKKPTDIDKLSLDDFWDKYFKMDLLLQKWGNKLEGKFGMFLTDRHSDSCKKEVLNLLDETREIVSQNQSIFNN